MFNRRLCGLLDRNNGDRVIGTLHERRHDGLFAGRIVVPEQNSKFNFNEKANHVTAQNIRAICPSKIVDLSHDRLGHSNIQVGKGAIVAG